jgi:hypothetical protein
MKQSSDSNYIEMKIPNIVLNCLENKPKRQFEAFYIETYLFDDFYKIKCSSFVPFPKKCLLVIQDYDLLSTDDGLSLSILKAYVKSTRINDTSEYLCLVDHSPPIVNFLQKSRHSKLADRFSPPESSFPVPKTSPNDIGFGLNSASKGEKFSKSRQIAKVVQSQDDILAALMPQTEFIPISQRIKQERNVVEKEEELGFKGCDFPGWFLVYLSYSLRK